MSDSRKSAKSARSSKKRMVHSKSQIKITKKSEDPNYSKNLSNEDLVRYNISGDTTDTRNIVKRARKSVRENSTLDKSANAYIQKLEHKTEAKPRKAKAHRKEEPHSLQTSPRKELQILDNSPYKEAKSSRRRSKKVSTENPDSDNERPFLEISCNNINDALIEIDFNDSKPPATFENMLTVTKKEDIESSLHQEKEEVQIIGSSIPSVQQDQQISSDLQNNPSTSIPNKPLSYVTDVETNESELKFNNNSEQPENHVPNQVEKKPPTRHSRNHHKQTSVDMEEQKRNIGHYQTISLKTEPDENNLGQSPSIDTAPRPSVLSIIHRFERHSNNIDVKHFPKSYVQ